MKLSRPLVSQCNLLGFKKNLTSERRQKHSLLNSVVIGVLIRSARPARLHTSHPLTVSLIHTLPSQSLDFLHQRIFLQQRSLDPKSDGLKLALAQLTVTATLGFVAESLAFSRSTWRSSPCLFRLRSFTSSCCGPLRRGDQFSLRWGVLKRLSSSANPAWFFLIQVLDGIDTRDRLVSERRRPFRVLSHESADARKRLQGLTESLSRFATDFLPRINEGRHRVQDDSCEHQKRSYYREKQHQKRRT